MLLQTAVQIQKEDLGHTCPGFSVEIVTRYVFCGQQPALSAHNTQVPLPMNYVARSVWPTIRMWAQQVACAKPESGYPHVI